MRRLVMLSLLLALPGCPRGDAPSADTLAVQTMPQDTITDLSTIPTTLPPAVPDTPVPASRRPRPRRPAARTEPSIPPAPEPLMAAVEREQAFTRFCYREFGLKTDPTLVGGVAMVVTVGSGGITDAKVENDNWSSQAGTAVNRCLNERARMAWKVAPGSVAAGRYVVPLRFTGS